jgi:hypothetical protein
MYQPEQLLDRTIGNLRRVTENQKAIGEVIGDTVFYALRNGLLNTEQIHQIVQQATLAGEEAREQFSRGTQSQQALWQTPVTR